MKKLMATLMVLLLLLPMVVGNASTLPFPFYDLMVNEIIEVLGHPEIHFITNTSPKAAFFYTYSEGGIGSGYTLYLFSGEISIEWYSKELKPITDLAEMINIRGNELGFYTTILNGFGF